MPLLTCHVHLDDLWGRTKLIGYVDLVVAHILPAKSVDLQDQFALGWQRWREAVTHHQLDTTMVPAHLWFRVWSQVCHDLGYGSLNTILGVVNFTKELW